MDETLSPSTLGHFTVVKQIGRGAFGTVFQVLRKSDNKQYAIKVIPLGRMDKKTCQNNLNEIRILCSVNHPHIVAYKEVFLDRNDTEMCVVMEFVGGGDLASKIADLRRRRMHLKEPSIWKYFIQVLLGLSTLHRMKIMHRDVKSANLFLTEDYQTVKLGDMNISKVAKDDLARTQIGTPLYLAPEVWSNHLYTNKCDVFSLGCVVYEMAALRLPFEAPSLAELCKRIRTAPIVRIPVRYSDELYDIVKLMVAKDPRARPSTEELLVHPLIVRKMLEQNLELYHGKEGRDQLINTIIMPHHINQLGQLLPKQKKYNRQPEPSRPARSESARALSPEKKIEVPKPGSSRNILLTPARAGSRGRPSAEPKREAPPPAKAKKLPVALNSFGSKKAEKAPPPARRNGEIKSKAELCQERLERLSAPKKQVRRSNSEERRPVYRFY